MTQLFRKFDITLIQLVVLLQSYLVVLTQHLRLLKSSFFESALDKIELEKKLTAEAKQAVKTHEVNIKVLSENEEDLESLVDAAMKRFRENQQLIKSNKVDIQFICPSINHSIRLFSVAKRS